MSRIEVLGVKVDKIKLIEVLDRLASVLDRRGQAMVVTANPEIIMLARRDEYFARILAEAELVTADGIGLVIASKILGTPLAERVTGIDLTQNLLGLAALKGWGVYFLGARQEVVQKAVDNIKCMYPGLRISGYHHGFFADSETEVIESIKKASPDILLAALGMGKQEKWIYEHQRELGVSVAIGVGGSFDVFAGAVKRAPVWMQKAGLEWLYRLITQPSRFFRMLELPKFLMAVLAYKFRGPQ